jgi:hypothetical protein
MGFLDNYLTVNQKVQIAHEKYPEHKIIANIIEHDLAAGYVLVQADFYRHKDDEKPAYRDFAYGNVAFYPNNMKRWFVEDTTSSAIGRVIAVALGLGEKPNRETMEQIERSKAVEINRDDQGAWGIKASEQESMPTAATAIADIQSQLGAEQIAEAPICAHGHMIFKTGQKNGREWGGWFCTEKSKAQQCPAAWAVKSVTSGNWRLA